MSKEHKLIQLKEANEIDTIARMRERVHICIKDSLKNNMKKLYMKKIIK